MPPENPSTGKTVVFFPEAAFGPALNSVGIAQACRDLGHRPVFVCDAGFAGVFQGIFKPPRPGLIAKDSQTAQYR